MSSRPFDVRPPDHEADLGSIRDTGQLHPALIHGLKVPCLPGLHDIREENVVISGKDEPVSKLFGMIERIDHGWKRLTHPRLRIEPEAQALPYGTGQ